MQVQKFLLFVFCGFIFSSLIAQKGLNPKEVPFLLPDYFELIAPDKNGHTITCYEGEPKKMDFQNMLYFNPWEKVKRVAQVEDKRGAKRMRTFQSWRFLFNESHLVNTRLPNQIPKEELHYFGVLNTDFVNDTICQVFNLSNTELNPIFQPFYFKKYEVTNKEYREFVWYVRDSMARTYSEHFVETEGEENLDWSMKIPWEDEIIQKKFYVIEHGLKRLKTDILIYNFLDKNGNRINVPVYPDTTSWGVDFPYNYGEPMIKNYYGHPAFDDYPVVGISYHQAKAFCYWKTKQIKAELPSSLAKKIKVDLPREYEWEWLATEACNDCDSDQYLIDDTWVADLQLSKNEQERTLKPYRSNSDQYPLNFTIDGALYTHPADLSTKELKKKVKECQKNPLCHPAFCNLDHNGISSMGDNVSEWIDETYQSWSFSFNRQMQRLKETGTTAANLARQIALYYDEQCDKDGYLVRGGNWYDERYSIIKGKNKAGIQAKTFLSPNKSRSTLGFRYVIRFTEM